MEEAIRKIILKYISVPSKIQFATDEILKAIKKPTKWNNKEIKVRVNCLFDGFEILSENTIEVTGGAFKIDLLYDLIFENTRDGYDLFEYLSEYWNKDEVGNVWKSFFINCYIVEDDDNSFYAIKSVEYYS